MKQFLTGFWRVVKPHWRSSKKQKTFGFLALGLFAMIVAHQISLNFNNVQGQLVTTLGEKN